MMVTCRFYSFDDKFLDEIKHVHSPIALSVQDYLPASVLNLFLKALIMWGIWSYVVEKQENL